MAPASFHSQLASLLEALAAQICRLVDGGFSELRSENQQLRSRLRLIEPRGAGDGGPGAGDGGPRRPGGRRRRTRTPRGGVAASSGPAQGGGASWPPAGSAHADAPLTATPTTSARAATPTIKTEDGGEPWPERGRLELIGAVGEGTEAPPTSIKQEVEEEAEDSPHPDWLSQDGTTSCWSSQPDSAPSLDAWREEPGHAFEVDVAVGVSSDPGGGGFSLSEGAVAAPFPARKEGPSGGGRAGGGARAFVCTCCGKTLASLKNLNTHMRVHTGEKPFACARCGKRFSDPSNLKRHQSVHTGEKRYGCVHCGKRFAQSGSLKVHMSVHSDCKQFRCSSCGKTFISGAHLRRHAAAHAAERERPPPPLLLIRTFNGSMQPSLNATREQTNRD